MKITTCRKRIPAAIAVIALSIVAAPGAKAACAVHNGGAMFAPGLETLQDLAAPDQEDSLDQAGPLEGDRGKNDSRVTVLGLWKKLWFAGGALNDVGFAHFNAGGTELVNDVGALNGGNNFCIGAWKQVGSRRYELVHPFFVFDGKNAIGVAIEKSELTVSRDGNRFRGTWTQDNYDLSGNLVPGFHVEGTIMGTRITPGSSFPFPFPF